MAVALPVLDVLPASERSALGGLLHPVRLPARAILCQPGQPCPALWFPGDAVVARVAVRSAGHVQEVGLAGAGSAVGAFGLIGDGLSPWRCEVRLPGLAVMLDRSAFAQLRTLAPSLVMIVENVAQEEARQLARDFALRHCRLARTCVAGRLIDYFETLGVLVLRMTHAQIAQLLSLRRATVTLALQELEAEKAIKARRGTIELLNPARLAQFAKID